MASHKVKDKWYSVDGNNYQPGIYADEKTAKAAEKLDEQELIKLQNSLDTDVITFDMIKNIKKKK